MSASTTNSPSVAIIGTEGAGKTVLTAVMAKRLGNPEANAFLNPQGPATLKHVERVWSILQGEDWPEGNPAGELFQLHWSLEIDGRKVSEVRFIEAPGQDFRVLFEGEQYGQEQDAHLKNLGDYCRNANLVMFLINLQNFIGEKNAAKRSSNEAAIKAAMDSLSGDGKGRSFCIVITQADLIRTEADRVGGWNKLMEVNLPNLHGAYIRHNKATVFAVAAVNDTVLRDEPDGRVVRVPLAGFGSEGLDDLISWMKRNVRKLPPGGSAPPAGPVIDPLRHGTGEIPDPDTNPPPPPEEAYWARILAPVGTVLLCLFFLPSRCTRPEFSITSVPDDRTWPEILFGVPPPGPVTVHHDVTSWVTVIIITLIVAAIAFFIGMAIDEDNSK